MALQTSTTDKIVLTFISTAGKETSLSFLNPDRTKTEAQLITQAAAMVDSDVLKPDGTSLVACTGIKFVRTEESEVPIDSVSDDDDDNEGGNA